MRIPSLDSFPVFLAWLGILLPVYTGFCGGVLQGKVTGMPAGKPLAGAHVIILRDGRGIYTDQDGQYRFEGVQPGKTVIRVSFIGYRTAEKQVVIREKEPVRLDFNLETEVLTSPEVEIMDTRSVRMPQDKPVRMEVIPAQAISNNPGQSIVSTLDYISGVNLSSTMGIFATSTVVTLRGLSGDDQARTLVLLDDIPLNKADGGSVNWNLVNRENVEQIEIEKGPGPAKYGTGAMGGVISIRSKKPTRLFSGMATVDYGTFHTAGLRYQLGGKIDPGKKDRGFYYALNGFFRRSDGYNSEIPEYLEKSDTFYVDNYLREASIGFKTGYQFNASHQIEAGATFFNDKRGRGTAIYEIDGAYERHGTWQADLRYKGTAGKATWGIFAYNQDEHFERLNEYMSEGEYNLYQVLSNRIDRGAKLGADLTAGVAHHLTAGVDYQFGSVYGQDIYFTSTDLITNAGKMDTWACYLQDEIRLRNTKVQFNLGIRLNYAIFHDGLFTIEDPSYSIQYLVDYQDSLFPTTRWFRADPKLSVQYRFTPVSRIYFSAAQGFRAPNLDDLCRTGRIRNGFKVANPALKPEILTNFETGTDLLFFKKLRVAASLYYSWGRDFMYYVSTGDSVNLGYRMTPVFMKQNITRVNIVGLELDLSLDPVPWLSVFANYTHNHSQIGQYTPNNPAVDPDLTGKYLTDVPANKVSAGATYRNPFVNLYLLWKFTGKRYINDMNEMDPYLLSDMYPSYQVVGLRAWHTFFKKLTVALNFDNIFDVIYIDDRLQQSPGRMITAELTFNF